MSKPLDLTTELISIKRRLEALEQRVYTFNDKPKDKPVDWGASSPYDLRGPNQFVKRRKR